MEAGMVVWAAGVKSSQLAQSLKISLERSDRVPVTARLNLASHPEIFVVGDMAYLEGFKKDKEAYPQLAPVAIQQGKLAAHNILAELHQQPLKDFHYLDKGNISTIGRQDAVAEIFGLHFSGMIAWLIWLVVHLFYLVGFRNRVLVLMGWAYNYFTYNLGVRLLGGHDKEKLA